MQIGGNYAWGAGTPHLNFYGNLMLCCRGINRSKKYLKVNLRIICIKCFMYNLVYLRLQYFSVLGQNLFCG